MQLRSQAAAPAALLLLLLGHLHVAADEPFAPADGSLPAVQLKLHNAKLDLASVRLEVAVQQVNHERQLERGERRVELRKLEHLEGEAARDRRRLEDEIFLAEKRHEQAVSRFQASEELANQGLISQASLELDSATVRRTLSDLDMAQEQLRVFQRATFPRRALELATAVKEAMAELELQRVTGEAAAETLLQKLKRAEQIAAKYTEQLRNLRKSSKGEAASRPATHEQGLLSDVDNAYEQATIEQAAQRTFHANQVLMAEKLAEAAALEVEEFEDGIAKQKLHEQKTAIRTASEALKAARQQLAWSERVTKKGYLTPAELESDRLTVIENDMALKAAQSELKFLREHLLARDERELRLEFDAARREIERARRLKEAALARARAVVAARKYAYQLTSGSRRRVKSDSVSGGE